jgi:choline kinase/phosphohistidine swiveling domain-containing protein
MPSPLLETEQGEVLLDKQLESLQQSWDGEVCCLAGYHIEKLINTYPDIDYYYDENWQNQGDVAGIAQHSELLDGELLLVNGSTLFEPEAVERLRNADCDVSIGIKPFSSADEAREAQEVIEDGLVALEDGGIEAVSGDDTVPDAHLTGPVHLTSAGTRALDAEIDSVATGDDRTAVSQYEIFTSLAGADVSVRAVDICDTAHLYDGDGALAKYLLGTKADTLARLERHVETASFPDQIVLSLDAYEMSPTETMDRIRSTFGSGPIVVRSSAATEDGWHDSKAGAFHSELDVDPTNEDEVAAALERVAESLLGEGSSPEENDQILVQEQIEDVAMSGVAFTRELDSGGPYTVINYDDESGRTDMVTAGQATSHRTAYFHHSVDGTGVIEDQRLDAIKRTVDEIRSLLDDPPLDVEFVVDDRNEVMILQVRPLAVHTGEHRYDERDVNEEIAAVREQVDDLQRNRPFLLGDRTVLGVMPDWNPAEMIGSDPGPLAISLYEYLITDDVWARARAASGYRDVTPTPLMVTLAGRSYIDTLVDFNSFLPDSLPEDLGRKLVEHYVDRLSKNPHLQDKVEFDVAFTCLDFGFEERITQLEDGGFTEEEIETLRCHLRSLTDRIVRGDVASIAAQRDRLVRLGRRRRQIASLERSGWPGTVRQVKQLLEDTRRFGSLPFAILARYAFIATAFLRSLVDRGVLTDEERETILEGIPTIAGELAEDSHRLQAGTISAERFFERYGHLRPGTYDICSPRYDERPETYFDVERSLEVDPLTLDRRRDSVVEDWTPEVSDEAESVFDRKQEEIATLIDAEGFDFSVDELYRFVTRAIPLRELAKFEFTRNVSLALTLLRRSGQEELGIEPFQLAELPIERLLEPANKNPSPVLDREIERAVNYREKRDSVQSRIELPPLIRHSGEVRAFEVSSELPNYITSEKTTAPTVVVGDDMDIDGADLDGHIVLIPAADPGYDWIFGHDIDGLVTKFGGVASHMAIRAAEFGLPAAIGCGEVIFEEIATADVVELDCDTATVTEVS